MTGKLNMCVYGLTIYITSEFTIKLTYTSNYCVILILGISMSKQEYETSFKNENSLTTLNSTAVTYHSTNQSFLLYK